MSMNYRKNNRSDTNLQTQNNEFLSNSLSDAIHFLRWPMILMVICIHVDCVRPNEYVTFFIKNICSMAVPVFFVISGILFFKDGLTFESYIHKLRKRIHTLLIPYIAWNTIAISVIALSHIEFYKFTIGNVLAGLWDSNYSFIESKSHAPMDFPLWYIRDLMVCCILSPLFFIVIRYSSLILPVALLVFWILDINTNVVGLSINSMAFYALGCWIATKKNDISYVNLRWLSFLVLSVSIALPIAVFYETISLNALLRNYLVLILVISVFPIARWINQHFISASRIVTMLGSSVFCLYALHALIIKPISRICYSVISYDNFMPFLVSFYLTTIACMLAFYFISKFKTLNLILNGR